MENFTFSKDSNLAESEPYADIRIEAMSYTMYKIGEAINKVYHPMMIPIGVLGNILSFLVMIQPHNRHMSISLYISVLAVSDTCVLFFAFITYLNLEFESSWPNDRLLFCKVRTVIAIAFSQSSVLLIVFMTFDRFYSIIRSHKAASFNTVKRAKITILCIFAFSFLCNIPHLFLTVDLGNACIPYALYADTWYNKLFFWMSTAVVFLFPFVTLLAMNCVIIHTLRTRLKFSIRMSEGQGQSQGHDSKRKNNERQIYIILLLIAFAFFILTTPVYAMLLFVNNSDYNRSPKAFAEYYLFFNVSEKAVFTNYGINFFLYVMSGHKFRTDLVGIFRKKRKGQDNGSRSKSRSTTEISTIEASTQQ